MIVIVLVFYNDDSSRAHKQNKKKAYRARERLNYNRAETQAHKR